MFRFFKDRFNKAKKHKSSSMNENALAKEDQEKVITIAAGEIESFYQENNEKIAVSFKENENEVCIIFHAPAQNLEYLPYHKPYITVLHWAEWAEQKDYHINPNLTLAGMVMDAMENYAGFKKVRMLIIVPPERKQEAQIKESFEKVSLFPFDYHLIGEHKKLDFSIIPHKFTMSYFSSIDELNHDLQLYSRQARMS